MGDVDVDEIERNGAKKNGVPEGGGGIGSQKFKQTFPAKINHFHLTSFLKEIAVLVLQKWKQNCNFHWKFRPKKLI